MSCAQIAVTGSTLVAESPATVSFPGAYSGGMSPVAVLYLILNSGLPANSPGIVTSLFGITSYTPPGKSIYNFKFGIC